MRSEPKEEECPGDILLAPKNDLFLISSSLILRMANQYPV
ncbi:hypothetical protein AAKU52_003428 [Pedobacter sp. CG_S7]